MSRFKVLTVTSVLLILYGCGGSDAGSNGGGIRTITATPTQETTPTPVPTPTLTSTPTPTSSSCDNSSQLSDLNNYKQFDTIESVLRYDQALSGSLTLVAGSSDSPVNTFNYQADGSNGDQYYYLSGSTIPPHNTPATYYNVTFPSSSSYIVNGDLYNPIRHYRVMEGTTVYSLAIAIDTLFRGYGNIDTSFGTVEVAATNASTGVVSNELRAFGYGYTIGQSRVPASGTRQYTSSNILGRAVTASGGTTYDVTGTISINMNYATRTYTGTLLLAGTDTKSGASVALGSFPITPNSAAGAPLNSLSATLGAGQGQFRAKLAYCDASEIEGAFNLAISDPCTSSLTLRLVGSFEARRNYFSS